VEGDLTGGRNSIDSARNVILGWLSKEAGRILPDAARLGLSFSISPDQGGVSAEALSEDEPPIWALQVIVPDKTVPGRNWVVEAALFQAGQNARVCVRLSCAARGEIGAFTPAVPAFIRIIADKVGIESGGERIASSVLHVTSRQQVDDLLSRLEDSQRQLPIIVVSEAEARSDQPSRWLVDVGLLARSLTGLSWVYCISYEAAFALSDAIGKSWSVFGGACRIYMPGFDRFSQSPYDHPLLLADRLRTSSSGEPWLRQAIARASIENSQTYLRFPRFVTLRSELANRRYERRKGDLTDQQQIEELKSENERLQDDIQNWTQLTQIAEEEKKNAHAYLDETKRVNSNLRAYIELLESTRKTGFELEIDRPEDYSEVPLWVEKSFSGRLVLSKKAQAVTMSSQYKDIGLVCDALEMLALHYVNMRREGDRRPIYEERLMALKIKEEAIGANLKKFQSDSQYTCRYEDRELFTDRHLKKGISRDPREILRIYFCWDEESRQVVVGHLTSHLETSIS
jgi:hypothetical protein